MASNLQRVSFSSEDSAGDFDPYEPAVEFEANNYGMPQHDEVSPMLSLEKSFSKPAPVDHYHSSAEEVHGAQPQDKKRAMSWHGQVERHTRTSYCLKVVVAMILGCGLGYLLQVVEPSKTVLEIIEIPGKIYVRLIQCAVIPLMFVRVALAVAEVHVSGKGREIVFKVVALFFGVQILAVLVGTLALAVIGQVPMLTMVRTPPIMTIRCGNGKYLESLPDNRTTCTGNADSETSMFVLNDTRNSLTLNEQYKPVGTLSANLLTILHWFVPSNFVQPFITKNLLSITMIAIGFGAAIALSFKVRKLRWNPMYQFMSEFNEYLEVLVDWVHRLTPFAVVSLLGVAISTPIDTQQALSSSMFLGILLLGGFVALGLVLLPIISILITHSNPFAMVKAMAPAYICAFGTSSSLVTLPVTLHCMQTSDRYQHHLSPSVANFVGSLGTMFNNNGSALYLAFAVLFMAYQKNLQDQIDLVAIVFLFIGSVLGSIATAPLPNGTLVILPAVWHIVFPKADVPVAYTFLMAIDWIMNRVVTIVNVHGNALVFHIVAETLNESNPAKTNKDTRASNL